MSRVGGIFILAGAAFVVVMGIRGSQHRLLPGLFGDTATGGIDVNTGLTIQGMDLVGRCYKLPDANLKCPTGTTPTSTGAGKVLCKIDGCS